MKQTLSRLRITIAAISLLAVASCAEIAGLGTTAERNRLIAEGYRVESSEFGRTLLVYSGPPTSDIRCLPRGGRGFGPLPEVSTLRRSTVQYRSDIRVTLRPGAVGEPVQREAFYVLTAITTPKRRNRRSTLETVNFSSGGQAKFRSTALTCRGR